MLVIQELMEGLLLENGLRDIDRLVCGETFIEAGVLDAENVEVIEAEVSKAVLNSTYALLELNNLCLVFCFDSLA